MQNEECRMKDKDECVKLNKECNMTNKLVFNSAFCILHSAFVFALTPSLHAQALLPPPIRESGEPLTLQRLEELADQYHPILPRDRAQIDAARGNATQAGMWNNPRFDTNNPQVFNGRTSLLNVGFQQEVPVMGKKRLDQAAANEVARQNEFTLVQDRLIVFTNIRQQFYQVLADQRRIQVLTELVGVLRSSYETGQKK